MLSLLAAFVVGGIVGFISCILLSVNALNEAERAAWQSGYNHGLQYQQRKGKALEENYEI